MRGSLFVTAVAALALVACSEEVFDDGTTSDDEQDGEETVSESISWECTDIGGFHASFSTDFSTFPQEGEISSSGVGISNYPFEGEEIFQNAGSVKEACLVGQDRTSVTVCGLRPERVYYVRLWCEQRGDDGAVGRYCSNMIKLETPADSWFANVSVTRETMKDASIAVRLSPYVDISTITGGYDMESLGVQMNATYKKLSPEFESWEGTDTPKEGIALDGESCFIIELHNLQPGERLTVCPYIDVEGERIYADAEEFMTYEIAVDGYVPIGACLFAACNVGGGVPYDRGTLFTDPKDAEYADAEAEVPCSSHWENLMSRGQWVCGWLENVGGWFVMDGRNTVFFPFTGEDESGLHFGYYWGGDRIHPAGSGAGFMAQLYFVCFDTPGLMTHMYYDDSHYAVTGSDASMAVRLVKFRTE